MPEISVVIPTFNRSSWIARAVRSAFAAGSDVEVIVVDDASTDDTPEVCRALRGVRYLRLTRNSGVACARNAGIDEARGEYVAFLDDDDERLPGSLDAQLALLKSNPEVSFAYGQVLIGDALDNRPTGEKRPTSPPGGDIFWKLLEANFIYVPSTMISKRHLRDVGKFDTRFPGLEDWDLWLRLAEQHAVVALDRPVAIYRLASGGSGQMSSDQTRMSALSELVREKALRLPRVLAAPGRERAAFKRYWRNYRSDKLIWTAWYSLERGHARSALRDLVEALRVHPLRAARPWTLELLVSSFFRSLAPASRIQLRPRKSGRSHEDL